MIDSAHIAALAAIVGDRGILTAEPDLVPCQTGARYDLGRASIVLRPQTTEEVSQAVGYCVRAGIALVPQSGNTGLVSGATPDATGSQAVLSLDRMVQRFDVDLDNRSLRLDAGFRLSEVNVRLADHGLFFPIDLGADPRLGGMLATNTGGSRFLRYGDVRRNTLGLKVVLADRDGTILDLTTALRKNNTGYDLKQLFIGSEGTLGVITSVTLRLQGIPAKISGGVCAFPTLEDACNAVITTIQMGIPVARIELLDEMQIRACNAYSQLTYAERPTLFVEFHGTEETVALQAAQFGEIAAEFGGGEFAYTANAEERTKLWKARHNAYWASRALAPELAALSTDVCVPISRLAECVAATQADIREHGFLAPIVGHAGDGNFHVLLLFDDKDAADVEKAEAFLERLNSRALAMEGTCTGEHGIGQGKIGYLEQELGSALPAMRAIKAGLDPDNIFNPGKIFRL